MIDFLKTKSTITPDLSLFHEVQDITREHFNHSVNRANQFYIADMQIMKAENHGKPQDRSYKHRIFTNPVKILRFLNRTIWCDCYFNGKFQLISGTMPISTFREACPLLHLADAVVSICLRCPTTLTHLWRINFPILIKWTSPLSF